MNIQELRIEIDKIDNKIIDLLNKRMNYVNQDFLLSKYLKFPFPSPKYVDT